MRDHPGDLAAPVVAHEMEGPGAVAVRRREVEHVGDEAIDAISREARRRIGAHAGGVAALVGGYGAVARGPERGHLPPPGVARLRIAVQQEHQWAVEWPRDLGREGALGRPDRVEHAQSRDITRSAKSSMTRYCRFRDG